MENYFDVKNIFIDTNIKNTPKLIFKIFYPFKNLNDYTCNFRAYKAKHIKKKLDEM